MWGDGLQTRSFTYIDDCVEGILRLHNSDCTEMLMKIGDKNLEIVHIPGPEGVRGRNSDNTLIKECLGWAPDIKLFDGLTTTYNWINAQLDKERENGVDVEAVYGTSKVVAQNMESDDQAQIEK